MLDEVSGLIDYKGMDCEFLRIEIKCQKGKKRKDNYFEKKEREKKEKEKIYLVISKMEGLGCGQI